MRPQDPTSGEDLGAQVSEAVSGELIEKPADPSPPAKGGQDWGTYGDTAREGCRDSLLHFLLDER